jgi:nucleobase:cation symporter-1, NCS1 family
VFCPLFGVVLADYFFLRKQRYFESGLGGQKIYWYLNGFNPWAFIAWGMGFGLYHLLQRQTTWGSSIPSLLAAGAIYLILMALFGRSPGFRNEGNGGRA